MFYHILQYRDLISGQCLLILFPNKVSTWGVNGGDDLPQEIKINSLNVSLYLWRLRILVVDSSPYSTLRGHQITTMTSRISGQSCLYLTVCSDIKKHQRFALLSLCDGNQPVTVILRIKGQNVENISIWLRHYEIRLGRSEMRTPSQMTCWNTSTLDIRRIEHRAQFITWGPLWERLRT